MGTVLDVNHAFHEVHLVAEPAPAKRSFQDHRCSRGPSPQPLNCLHSRTRLPCSSRCRQTMRPSLSQAVIRLTSRWPSQPNRAAFRLVFMAVSQYACFHVGDHLLRRERAVHGITGLKTARRGFCHAHPGTNRPLTFENRGLHSSLLIRALLVDSHSYGSHERSSETCCRREVRAG